LLRLLAWPGPYQDIGFASPVAFLLGFIWVSYPFWAGVLILGRRTICSKLHANPCQIRLALSGGF
jgi:hypothetical protein